MSTVYRSENADFNEIMVMKYAGEIGKKSLAFDLQPPMHNIFSYCFKTFFFKTPIDSIEFWIFNGQSVKKNR